MFVLEGSTSDPWTSNYTIKAELDTYDQFAIDGTYFRHSTGLYHVYSCWYVFNHKSLDGIHLLGQLRYHAYSSWPANLCITKMSDPWTVTSNLTERQIIR